MASNGRKPILISGAGLASLLFAQALRRASIPFLIFERDGSLSFRAQGYRLRLSSEGIDAIESVLSPEDFQVFWDTCGKTGGAGFGAIDASTGLQLEEPATPPGPSRAGAENTSLPRSALVSRGGKVVGIARGEMRKIFLSGCEDQIQWSRSVVGYRLTPTGVHAIFQDGSESVEGEMLVAGDGVYSKVAKQVSGGKLKVYEYVHRTNPIPTPHPPSPSAEITVGRQGNQLPDSTGARGIHGQAPTTAFQGLGEGVWRLGDQSKPEGKVFVITNVRSGDKDDPSIEFGWTMTAEPGVIKPPNNDYSIIGKPAADIAKALTADWHPRVKPLFDEMVESEAAFWKITCSTPTGVPEWPNEPRVTVLGDAAHSMTPAGGIGANTAVQDSALLGRLLREAGGYRDGVTAAYEKEMRVYGSEAVKTSYGMATQHFGINIDENTPTV